MRKRRVPVVLLLFISLIAFVLMSRGYIGSLVHPLLFEGKAIWAFFNNDIDGHAVDNARELHELVKAMI